MKTKISAGVVHTVPADLEKILLSKSKILVQWERLTPLARNEWICWIISVKKQETRDDHIRRIQEDLLKGKRRPCCWAGCIHRKNT
jgi:uncharacterized protein YdeI (YjbR/CyaY-like superfamily)